MAILRFILEVEIDDSLVAASGEEVIDDGPIDDTMSALEEALAKTNYDLYDSKYEVSTS
jgi:hypothetical protein